MACAIFEGERFLQRPLLSEQLRKRSRRAGPALPSYLALHHAGFSVPPMLPPERWALTPPFHPCQTERAFRRRPAGFPAGCHRASLGRRYIFCGTFREPQHDTKRGSKDPPLHPCYRPPGVTRRVALFRHRLLRAYDDGVRTFLPLGHLAMAKPAITRLTRQSHYTARRCRSDGRFERSCRRVFLIKLGPSERPIPEEEKSNHRPFEYAEFGVPGN